MAKRKKTPRAGAAAKAAVSVGTTLGKIAAKVDGWMIQRDEIAQELTSVISRAQSMLSSLGKSTTKITRQAATAVATATTAAKKTRRPMSAEGKARIAAAQRARWAKVKKAAKD